MSEKEVRRQRIRWLIDDLESRLSAWTDARRDADHDAHGHYLGRHWSQLKATDDLLTGSLEVLRSELAAIEEGETVGHFFARGQQVESSVVWLERVWDYFAFRFDQRDGQDPRARTVATADEMVWSCYRPAFEHMRVQALEWPYRPPPLAYVEPEYSPAARPVDSEFESGLEPSPALSALDEVAGQLPIPLLRLPPWSVGAPWWLIFIAHEVGHHLQHELKLIGAFRRAVEAVATAKGAQEKDVKRWGRWGEEIFADLVSLLLVGPWALWAMLEVERKPLADMTRRRGRYPPALIRIRIMAGMLGELDLDPTEALRGLDLAAPAGARPTFALDASVAEGVPPLIKKSWPSLGRLENLLRFDAADFRAGGVIESYRSELLSDSPIQPTRHVDTGRRVVCASLAAWAELARQGTSDLKEKAQTLADRTSEWVLESAPQGTRSESKSSGDHSEAGQQLAKALLALSRAEPGERDDGESEGEDEDGLGARLRR